MNQVFLFLFLSFDIFVIFLLAILQLVINTNVNVYVQYVILHPHATSEISSSRKAEEAFAPPPLRGIEGIIMR